MAVADNEYGGWAGHQWWEDNDGIAQGVEGETGGTQYLAQQATPQPHAAQDGAPPFLQNQQRPAKRPCMEDGGDHSTNTPNGTEGAYGMSRAEMDELTVRVAQMVSVHDQQIRELQACTYRKIIMSATGKYGESFIDVDTKWEKDRGENSKGALGSKHCRLAIALITEVYSDQQLGSDEKKTFDELFTGMDLQTDALGKMIRMMKWRTFAGNKDGALELSFAPGARIAETIMVRLMTQNGGRESQGTAPRGPAIRKIDERITDTWRTTIRADKENV